MANIPGIVGFTIPGAYSNVRTRANSLSLPGGPTVVCVMGKGQREEILVNRALGGGEDGAPAQFQIGNQPTGRYFKIAQTPIVPGSLELYLNPKGDGTDLPLIRISSTEEGAAWGDEFGAYEGYGATATELSFGLDAQTGESSGSGFFDSKYGRRYGQYRTRISQGSEEPQHFILDEETGEIVLDRALRFQDTLVVTYVAISDLNDPQQFFSPEELFAKHGYPTINNTLATGALMAFENGAGSVVAVHAGTTYAGPIAGYVIDPYWTDAFEALEKEDVDIIVPIQAPLIENEIVMPFWSEVNHGESAGSASTIRTVNGEKVYFLQQDNTATGETPGINISPLAVHKDDSTKPAFLRVFKNGIELKYGIDYTIPNLDGSVYPGTGVDNKNAAIVFTTPLNEGDKILATYRPDPEVIDLVATVQQVVKSHCEFMSQTSQRKERTFMTGGHDIADYGYVLDAVTGVERGFGDTFRGMYFLPHRVNRVISGINYELDGQYIAAAAAGRKASFGYIATSLTRKSLTGFTISRKFKYSQIQQNAIIGAGASLVAPLAAGGRIIMGKTTVNSGNATEEEPSVVSIRDYTAKSSRKVLEDRFTGRVDTVENILSDAQDTVDLFLKGLQGQKLINAFAGVSVKIDELDPRQLNVSFDINPVYPVNWISINFSIGVL